MGELIVFPANGRTGTGYLATASAPGAPGVVVVQEWWGLNAHIKSVADRLAAAGYSALAPDLYHGVVTREPDEAAKLLMDLNMGEAAKDLRGAIEHLRALTGRPVGVIGFCMGGALSLYAACENPDDIAACINFYGVRVNIEYNLPALRAPVLGIFAEHDDYVTPAVVAALDEQLTTLGKSHEFVTYPKTQHAFFNDDRPEIYDPAAAADAWQRVRSFLATHLG
jgi:carboxymethylenebutenolidase